MTNTSREHLMQCLARQVAQWSPSFQEAWLKDWAKAHSPELTLWLQKHANEHRLKLSEQADAEAAAARKAAYDAINECRRLTA